MHNIDKITADWPIVSGYTIDCDKARILDDGFKVQETKKGFILSFYVADTTLYYAATGKTPQLAVPNSDTNITPNIDYQSKRDHLSLQQELVFDSEKKENVIKPKPAVRIRMYFDEDGVLKTDSMKIDRVLFKNEGQYTHQDANQLMLNSERPMLEIAAKLARKIDRQAQTNRLERLKSKTTADLIMTTFSNVANYAFTQFAEDNDIPIIYQNRSAHLEWLNEDISTRQDAYRIIPLMFDEPEDAVIKQASLSAKQNDVDFSTTPTGNIIKGYERFARFSSPMQSMMDAANLDNIVEFIRNPEAPQYRFGKKVLNKIAGICGPRHIRNKQSRKSFNNEARSKGEEPLSSLKERFHRFKNFTPAHIIKDVIFYNADKDHLFAQEALERAKSTFLCENVVRCAVEQDGLYDALYFVEEKLGDEMALRPIIVKDGEKLSCPGIKTEKVLQSKSEAELVHHACTVLLKAKIDGKLAPPEPSQIQWPKALKKAHGLIPAKKANAGMTSATA